MALRGLNHAAEFFRSTHKPQPFPWAPEGLEAGAQNLSQRHSGNVFMVCIPHIKSAWGNWEAPSLATGQKILTELSPSIRIKMYNSFSNSRPS